MKKISIIICIIMTLLCGCSFGNKVIDTSLSQNAGDLDINITEETISSKECDDYSSLPIKPYFTGTAAIKECDDYYEVTAPLRWVEYMSKEEASAKELSGFDDAVCEFSEIDYSYKGVKSYYYFSGNNGRVYGRGSSIEDITLHIPKDTMVIKGKELEKPGVIDDNAERVTFDFYIKSNTKVEWENGVPEVFNCYFVSFDDKGNVKDIVFVWGFDADKLGA